MDRRLSAMMATQAAFQGMRFNWGLHDCVQLAAHTLRWLGYDTLLHRGGPYSTETGAMRALLRNGIRSTEEWVDLVVGASRIQPDEASMSDIVGFSDGKGLTALSVAYGDGRVLGFQHDMVCRIVHPRWGVGGATYVAWRCNPKEG